MGGRTNKLRGKLMDRFQYYAMIEIYSSCDEKKDPQQS